MLTVMLASEYLVTPIQKAKEKYYFDPTLSQVL